MSIEKQIRGDDHNENVKDQVFCYSIKSNPVSSLISNYEKTCD